jgi:hypothetical protein
MNSLTDLNGVTFGANTFGTAELLSGYTNGVGGATDVDTSATNPLGAQIANVAYITGGGAPDSYPKSGGTVLGAAQYVSGDGHYIAPTSTDFGTFGYLNLNINGVQEKYFVHGFSASALLLSRNQVLSVDQFNGIGTTDTSGTHFEILSNYDLTMGSASPNLPGVPPQGGYTTNHWTDSAGIYHYVKLKYASGPGGYQLYFDNLSTKNTAFINKIFPSSGGTFNANPPTYPLVFTNNETSYSPACFAEGVRIATARGEVAVEDLAVGDEVATASGCLRPVIWIGRRRVRPKRHPRAAELHPVRVRADAFGEGLPARDLRLSPGHAVFVDGVLIPVGLLVNGATVVQEEAEAVTYFHVELDAHDVLLAEGLPAESYLDDGNRAVFANADEHLALHGRIDPVGWVGACAPVALEGPALAAARARLAAQAEALGWRRVAEPALRLAAGEAEAAPLRTAGQRAWFLAPAGQGLRLRSTAAVLAHVAPEHPDFRRLGVAVGDLRIDGASVPLDGAAFGAGFHPLERDGERAWRWTDGDAELTLDLPQGALVEVTLAMVAPTWRRPAARLRLVEMN